MKKWLIVLCCILVAGIALFMAFMNYSNDRIDSLNKDLGDVQTEYNNLKDKSEKDEQLIEDLNRQVEDLVAENTQLSADKNQLSETLDGLNRNLTSSQQKLQGVMYILTDGAQGNIDSLLTPYIKIFQDVSLNDPYFEAVSYVNDHQLMAPQDEEVFGAADAATLGEFAESLYLLQGKTGSREEASAALLQAEQTWLASQTAPEAASEEAGEPAAEEAEAPAEEPAAEEAETPAEEPAAAEAETPAEEPAAEEAEAPAEEPVAEDAETPAEEPAAEEAEAPAEEPAAEEAEAPAEEPAAEVPAEDETLILTRERLLSLCSAFCYEAEKSAPEIIFPESASENATRGDLAVTLFALSR